MLQAPQPSSFWKRLRKRATQSTFSSSSTTTTPTHALSRTLGKLDVTLVGVGASIGAGIFVVSGEAAKVAGPAVVLSFFIAAVVCRFINLFLDSITQAPFDTY